MSQRVLSLMEVLIGADFACRSISRLGAAPEGRNVMTLHVSLSSHVYAAKGLRSKHSKEIAVIPQW